MSEKNSNTKICAVDGCNRVVSAKFLCSKHYRRNYAHGSPTIILSNLGKSLRERLEMKIEIREGSDCWWWTGVTDNGYGRIRNVEKMLLAHRVAWELENGPIPEDPDGSYHGLCVCHHCDNRKCCNPSHLFLGNHRENMADMDRKGRRITSRGIGNGNTNLTESDVLEIRDLVGQISRREIGEIFNLGKTTVLDIVNRKTWRHLK